MSDDPCYALGVDLGGTTIKSVCVTHDGELICEDRTPTEDTGDEAWRARVCTTIRNVQEKAGRNASHIGIAAPGLAAKDNRSISWMAGRMVGPMGVDWQERLGTEFPVWVLNDSHAALTGEHWLGAARDGRSVAMLTLGTGVGGAIMLNGELLQGAVGRAGSVGHVCLNPDGEKDIVNTPGSLEDAIGNWSVAQRTGGRFASTEALVKAVEAGDGEAERAWDRSIYELACGIVTIVNVVDPETIILGGGIAEVGAPLTDRLEKYLDDVEWRPHGHRAKIVRAELGDLAGAYGAARFAMQKDGA